MKINLHTHVGTTGYGVVGIHILKWLMELGHEVALHPLIHPEVVPGYESWFLIGLAAGQDLSQNEPSILIGPPDWEIPGLKPHCHLSFFETDSLSNEALRIQENTQVVLLPSEWAAKVLRSLGFQGRVEVLPMGVEPSILQAKDRSRSGLTSFLNVGKWERRKAQEELVEAFNLAFTETDPVELRLLCDNSRLGSQSSWRNWCKSTPLGSKIRFLERRSTFEEVTQVMTEADCGVFPSRGEGWNLGLLEMMACGKTVIATDFSAHTQYCNASNALLVAVTELEEARDEKWSDSELCGSWAQIGQTQIEQICNHMRSVHHKKKNGLLEANSAGRATASELTWENTARSLVTLLESTL